MKKLFITGLLLLTAGCINQTVIMVETNDRVSELIINKSLSYPLNRSEASYINNLSCNCAGELELINENWAASCCIEYPDCRVRINQYNGTVICEQFG